MNKFDTVIGIDPGAGGGIAYFHDGNVKAVKMPMDAVGMQEYLNYIRAWSINPVVFIEKLQYRPSDRNIPGRDYQIAKMLKHYEKLITTMELMPHFPVIEVHPVTWQTYLHLKLKKEEDHDDRKRRYRDAAQEWYKQIKATLWNCDALLLVEFGRRKLAYDPTWVQIQIEMKDHKGQKTDLF